MRITRALPLYGFLHVCNQVGLEKKVLDCGAGGENPPLEIFYKAGYRAYGIELSIEQLDVAKDYSLREGLDLKLVQGDMCAIPYPDQSFSFLYSWNTTVHMNKEDVKRALSEFHRVLVPGGLCYINFLSQASDSYGVGKKLSEGIYEVQDGEGTVQFSHYEQAEIEACLGGFELIQREERIVTRFIDGRERRSGFYDYIVKKVETK